MEKDTIDLRSLLDLLLRRLWIVLGSAVLMGAAFFAFAKFVMPLKYESYTSMYVKNNTNTLLFSISGVILLLSFDDRS